jgi:aminoglycoside 3-N-acetyltransferase
MNTISRSELPLALAEVGVSPGQIIYLQTDLRAPGRLEGVKTKQEFCNAYLGPLLDCIGTNGTLVAPTFSTQVARYDIDFIWEETPTKLGLFPEFIRSHPDSLRSLHPLHSVSAIGALKDQICSNNGASDFGWDSPYHRMIEAGANILTIGLEPSFAVAIANSLEALCGLPYNYNKLLKWRPIIGGIRSETEYFSNARHLSLNTRHILRHFADRADEAGLIRRISFGASTIQMSNMREVFDFGVEFLKREPYGLLESPPTFEYGVVPFDGPTIGRDGIGDRVIPETENRSAKADS